MAWFRACIVLVLLVTLAFSVTAIDLDPKSVSGVDAKVSTAWDFTFTGALPTSVEFDTYLYSPAYGTRVSYSPTTDCSVPCTTKSDGRGNTLLHFTFVPTASPTRVTFTARVQTDYSALPGEPGMGTDAPYVQASEYVHITPAIQSLAATIVEGASNDKEKIVRITDWVHRNVQYDGPGYRDVLLTSTQVLEAREGKCSEFSHLAAALLRAEGIPTRFVAGEVYSGEEWSPHAWLESKAEGAWWPLDPTFGEALVVDGTHLAFARAVDQAQISELVTTRGPPTSKTSFTRSETVELTGSTPFSGVVSLQLTAPTNPVGPGSAETLTVRASNLATKAIGVPLTLTTTADMQIPDGKDKLVYVPAGQTASASWALIVPSNLSSRYVYTYPLSISSLGARAQVNLTARADAVVNQLANVRISNLQYRAEGSHLSLTVRVQNQGNLAINGATLTATLPGQDNQTQTFSLAPLEEKDLTFTFIIAQSANAKGTLYLTTADGTLVQPFALENPTATPIPSGVPTTTVRPAQPLESVLEWLNHNAVLGALIVFGAVILLAVVGRLLSPPAPENPV